MNGRSTDPYWSFWVRITNITNACSDSKEEIASSDLVRVRRINATVSEYDTISSWNEYDNFKT